MTRKFHSPRFIVFTLASVVFLSGCVAVGSKIDSTRMASVRKIAVHPMEPSPFMTPWNPQQMKVEGILKGIGFVVGSLPIGPTPGTDFDLWKRRVSRLESGGTWHPTKVVARQVEAHLKGRNRYDVQSLLPMTKLYGSDKRDIYHPYAPIRAWYNSDKAARGSLGADSDIVVEVGLSNYEVGLGYLVVQVHMRVVDPATGKVLGRAREHEYVEVSRAVAGQTEQRHFGEEFKALAGQGGVKNFMGYLFPAQSKKSMDKLFANEAQFLKALFTEMTQRITEKALRQLGL